MSPGVNPTYHSEKEGRTDPEKKEKYQTNNIDNPIILQYVLDRRN